MHFLNRDLGLEHKPILEPSIEVFADYGLSAIVSSIATFPMVRKFPTECCVAIVKMWLASSSGSAWTPELAYLNSVKLWLVTYSKKHRFEHCLVDLE